MGHQHIVNSNGRVTDTASHFIVPQTYSADDPEWILSTVWLTNGSYQWRTGIRLIIVNPVALQKSCCCFLHWSRHSALCACVASLAMSWWHWFPVWSQIPVGFFVLRSTLRMRTAMRHCRRSQPTVIDYSRPSSWHRMQNTLLSPTIQIISPTDNKSTTYPDGRYSIHDLMCGYPHQHYHIAHVYLICPILLRMTKTNMIESVKTTSTGWEYWSTM